MSYNKKATSNNSIINQYLVDFEWLSINPPKNSHFILNKNQGYCKECNAILLLIRDTLNKHSNTPKHLKQSEINKNSILKFAKIENKKGPQSFMYHQP